MELFRTTQTDFLKGLTTNADSALLTKIHTHFPNFYLTSRSYSSFDYSGNGLQIPKTSCKALGRANLRLKISKFLSTRRWNFHRQLCNLLNYE